MCCNLRVAGAGFIVFAKAHLIAEKWLQRKKKRKSGINFKMRKIKTYMIFLLPENQKESVLHFCFKRKKK